LYDSVPDPQTGERFDVLRCTGCGLGQTSPKPADMGPYYGEHYHGGRHGVTERMCMARRLRMLRQVAGSGGRLLDFGCGDGGFLHAAEQAGWEAVGVEMNLSDARRRGLTVVERLDDADGSFDVITLWHSLEHVHSPRQTLEALTPRLRAGGHIIIAVPNLASLQASIYGRHWFHLDAPRHLSHFTPPALFQLLERQGLKASRRWNLETELDLFGWIQSALNRVLPRPNVLFDILTRRGGAKHETSHAALSVAVGSLVGAVCTPILPFSTAFGRGAVLVVAARLPE
jgi:SAM-dependent methyltransferase